MSAVPLSASMVREYIADPHHLARLPENVEFMIGNAYWAATLKVIAPPTWKKHDVT
jgi:hypothetical protein